MSDHADAARSVILEELSFHNLRCWKEGSFKFGPHINIFWGPNAQGKTSILEALHLLSVGRSFRTNRVQEITRSEEEVIRIKLGFSENGVSQQIKYGSTPDEKRILLNSTPYPALSTFIGMIPVVILTPDDEIVKAPPAERRRFLDLLLSQENPLYLHHLTRYSRALKQRNALLRSKSFQTISSWEAQLAHSGAFLIQFRLDSLALLSEQSEKHYSFIAGSEEKFEVNYEYKFTSEEELLKELELNRARESKFGTTLIGPHRDTLKLTLNGQDAKKVMSEGQMRTASIALKLGSWSYLKVKLKKSPTLLIDDFGISLDKTRRSRLIELLNNCGQVFITATDSLEEDFTKPSTRFLIKTVGKA